MFRRIVFSACLAGLLAGLILTAVQRIHAFPALFEAEIYESADPVIAGGHGAAPAHEHGHGHENGKAWAPADGLERTFFTALSNVLSAIAFGLLLCAAYALRKEVDWRQGMLWGLAGFAVFFVNPSLGLHPEVPGTLTAELEARQVWWVLTVVCTAGGLGLLVFQRPWFLKVAGAALLLLPHGVGAPLPEVAGASVPAALTQQFVIATAIANGIFWVVLGTSSAIAFKRLA